MKIQLIYIVLLLPLFLLNKVIAQGVKSPTKLVLFENMEGFNNAALLEKKDAAHIGTQGQFGAFSEIRTIYGLGSYSLGPDKNYGLGLSIYSFQEGELIAENRVKLIYWKKIKLNDKTDLVAGGQAGLINASYKATRSTAGANAYTPTYNFGLSLKNETTSLALAINQLSNSSNEPLTQINYYKAFYTILLSKRYEINERIDISFHVHSNYSSFEKSTQGKINFDYLKAYQVGLGYGTNGLLLSAGITEIEELDFPIGINFGYRIPLSSKETNAFQPYQLNLSYTFK